MGNEVQVAQPFHIKPDEPIGHHSDCAGLFRTFSGEIEKALPKHLTVELLLKAALNSVRKNPKLLECTKASMLSALMFCAEVGLVPDTPTQECHLIPFYNGKTQRKEVQWMGGYRGYMKLARNSGEIAYVVSEVVYEKDEFDYERGLNPRLVHKPFIESDDRGQPTYFYSIAIYRDKDIPSDFEVMSKAQVDEIRSRSQARNGDAWKYNYEEMGRKTVIRRHIKRLPQSPEMALAAELDNAATMGEVQPLEVSVTEIVGPEKTPTENLADELEAKAKNTNEDTDSMEGANVKSPKVTVAQVRKILDENSHAFGPEIMNKYTEERLKNYTEEGLALVKTELEAHIETERADVSKTGQREEAPEEAGGQEGQQEEILSGGNGSRQP